MYIPHLNRVEDAAKITAFIHAYGFATLVTQSEGVLVASHLPVLLDERDGNHGSLRSHMASANDQWRQFHPAREVLCIFQGPHSYISPSWYQSKIAVPTWNYAAVHVYGLPQIIEEPAALRKIVIDTTAKYESKLTSDGASAPQNDLVDALLRTIIGFSIRITRIEAKFKLGQNRPKEDQESMLRALGTSESADSRALAEFIKAQVPGS
jgi:transcriptional regulator